jgi:hypothetical protein
MPNDDDNRYLSPLEGPPDPNAPHVTVDCSRGDCRMSFFVAKDDPRLPDGPFLCHDHDDRPTKFKMADHVELTITCDRCGASSTVIGQSRGAAWFQLLAQGWRFVNQIDGPAKTAPDLCVDCAKKL